jgi:ABC-2 type transport system permease protein
MLHILKKEINAFLNSLIAYMIITVFLTGMGLILWVFPDTSILEYGFADMGALFTLAPYIFMFLIPAITMRMFSEEKKSGTLELLLTSPIRDIEIILGKFLAGFTLVLFAIIPTLIYFATVFYLGNPPGNIDVAGTFGSYIGLILLGFSFTSVGVFSSALSENQVVAFIIAAFLCFLLYTGFSSVSALPVWGSGSYIVEQLGMQHHYLAMSKGLIDARNVVYFLSLAAVMLLCTNFVMSSRKW